MNNRILLTYATRTGSTVGVADAMALVLRKRGFLVTIEPIQARPSIQGYQAIVIGSAVRQGAWLPEAVTYLIANQAALRRVRVALFTVHGFNQGDDEISRRNREAYIDPVRTLVTPIAHVFFPGKIDPARLSLFDRLMIHGLRGVAGDYRDWGKVNQWASTLLTEDMARYAVPEAV